MPTARAVSTRSTLAGALIVIAGICYSSWVLEFFWQTPLDPLRSFLSELDAANRPHRNVYVVGDVTTSVCAVIAAALLLWPRSMATSRWATGAVIAYVVFGIATIADALSPIGCIPNVDPGCPVEPPGLVPQLHHLHALTSTVAVFSIFAVMIGGVVAAYRSDQWPLLRWWGAAALGVVALATLWLLVADNLSGDALLGLAQRIQVGGMSAWLMVWGVAVIRGGPALGRTDRAVGTPPTGPTEWRASPLAESEAPRPL